MKTSIQKLLSVFLLFGIVISSALSINKKVYAEDPVQGPDIVHFYLSSDNFDKTLTNKDKNVKIFSFLGQSEDVHVKIKKLVLSKKDITKNVGITNIVLKSTGSTPSTQDFKGEIIDNKIIFSNMNLLLADDSVTKLEIFVDVIDGINNEGEFYLSFNPRSDIETDVPVYISNKTEELINSYNIKVQSLKPDLQVNNIYYTRHNQLIHVDICNNGQETVKIADYIISFSSPKVTNFSILGTNNLDPSGCSDSAISLDNLKIDQSGEYHITAIVDYTNKVKESNENNNILFKYINIDIQNSGTLDPITDFRIVGNELRWTTPKNVDGYNITFYTGETYNTSEYFGGCGANTDYDLGQIRCSGSPYISHVAGDTGRLELTQGPVKSFIIKYKDVNGNISKPSNVVVYKKSNAAPDLYVSGMGYGYNPSNNVVNVTICNKGNQENTKSTELKLNSKYQSSVKVINESIPVGQCKSAQFSVEYNLGIRESGNYTLEAYVDSNNSIDELNENNNNYKTAFDIRVENKYLDWTIEDIKYEQTATNYGKILYKVCNRGNQSVSNDALKGQITPSGKVSLITYNDLQLQENQCIYKSVTTKDLQIEFTGRYVIEALIDKDNVDAEKNENNNFLRKEINVTLGKENILPAIKDLRIEGDELRWTAPSNEIQRYQIVYHTGETTSSYSEFGGCGYDMYQPANGNSTKYCAGDAIDITKTKGHLERLKLNSTSNTYIVSYTDQYGNSSTVSNSAYKKKETEKPDLYINNLIYNPNNQKFEFQVCNQGMGGVESSEILVQTKVNNEWVVNRGDYGQLDTGSCFSHSEPIQNFGITKTGSYAINVKVDQNNTISETNENNNNLYKTLYVNLGTDPVVYFLGPKDLHVKFDEQKNPSLEWTNPGNATEFAVAIYTGEISDNDFYSKVKTYGYNYRPITEYDKRDSFRFDGSERNAPITVAIKLRDINGIESSYSNIYRYYGYGTKNKFPAPPAGFEDEVITAYTNYTNPFPDTDLSKLEGKAAAELYRRAVIGGFPDGEFKGSRAVNRAELAKFLLLARYGAIGEYTNNGKFPDVLDGQWYVKYVVRAANLGIIQGYPDGTFGPEKTVNTAEFLKMLTLTFGLPENIPYPYTDVDKNAWYARYAGIASKYQLFPDRGNQLRPEKNLTRKEVAIAIYQYLKNR